MFCRIYLVSYIHSFLLYSKLIIYVLELYHVGGLVDVRYLTLSTDVPWNIAKQFCEGEGAHLAEIHNEAQFDLVLTIGRGTFIKHIYIRGGSRVI